jgi:outer membrane lipoprotein LolB
VIAIGEFRPLIIVGACLLMAACATPRDPRPAGAWLEEREAFFADHPEWSIDGRVSLSDGERGGSLSFSWQAIGEQHQIHLRTGAGGRQWRLHFSSFGAELEGSEVGRIVGEDPDPLVEEAIGWPIPVRALAWWIRGLQPPESGQLAFADDGTLERASDGVWLLEYGRWKQIDERLFPVRLQAVSEPYQVRIVIRDWRFGVEGQ